MRQSVRALVLHDGKLLLMKRHKAGREFYTLPGGGIDDGETPEQAVIREMQEEASLVIANPKVAFRIHDSKFGEQLVYRCDYVSGEPALAPDSSEAAETAKGENTYEPFWFEAAAHLSNLTDMELLPLQLKVELWGCLRGSFPDEPIELTINS